MRPEGLSSAWEQHWFVLQMYFEEGFLQLVAFSRALCSRLWDEQLVEDLQVEWGGVAQEARSPRSFRSLCGPLSLSYPNGQRIHTCFTGPRVVYSLLWYDVVPVVV